MYNILLLIIIVFFFITNTSARRLVFIADLNLVFAKDWGINLLVVKSKLVSTVKILEKLIVYLNNGTVLNLMDKSINDNVDAVATSYLSD